MTAEIMYRAGGGIYGLELRSYPDRMPLLDAPAIWPNTLLLRPRSLESFFAAMFWVDAVRERGRSAPHLILPNVPGARQDRLNDSGDFLFTAKSIAQAINARQFPRVTVLDPHSDVVPALIDRCTVIPATFDATNFDGSTQVYDGVISPDAGAEKRAGRIAKALGIPLLHAWKTRDVATGSISGFGVEPLRPLGYYLVVDDLCDAGGTFIGLAGAIRNYSAVADLYVTHGLFTKGTASLLSQFSRVYCTDSVLGDKPHVTVLPRCETLLRDHS